MASSQQAPPNNQQQQNRRPTQAPLEKEMPNHEEIREMEVVTPSVIEAQERAQVDVQVATANRYPRGSLAKVKDRMMEMATLDEETAAACFYTLKRKDSDGDEKIIQDASVRLAEISVACYKNIAVGTQIVGNDGQRITAQGMCWDVENNIRIQQTVDRPIASKDSRSPTGYRTWSLDMQIVTANAASSIAFRNAAFKVIPKALIKPILERCKKIAAGEGPIEQRFQKAARSFRPFGITELMLRAYLDKALDKPIAEVVTEDDIVNLIGLFTGLRDGEHNVQEVFANINKDGTLRTPKPAAESTSAGEGQQSGEGGDGEGGTQQDEAVADDQRINGFTPGMLGEELESLYGIAKKNGHISNNAQFLAFIGKFEGTKNDLRALFAKPRREK